MSSVVFMAASLGMEGVKVGGSVVEAMVGLGDDPFFYVSSGLLGHSFCCCDLCFERYNCVFLLLKSRGEWLRSEMRWQRGFDGVVGKFRGKMCRASD